MDPRHTPPLLERESELQTLGRLLERAGAGDGQIAFVGGEAGVGKTSLVRRFAADIACRAHVVSVSCDGLSTPEPLAPVLDAASQLALDVAPLGSGPVHLDRLYRAVLDAFDPDRVTVVIGENAHWTDEATLGVIRFFARHLDNRRLLVIVTFRDDELGTTHPLLRLLGDLAPDPRVHRVTLRPLSAEAVRILAETSAFDPRELFERTGGNPFYVTEVLALGGAGVPPTVRDAILARASRLSPAARAVLETASVIGSPIDLDLLTRITGPVIAEVEECLATGLLSVVDGDLAFRHELARDAVLASIVPPRRRLIHAAVLAALAQSPRPERDLATLAYHAESAGDACALTYALAAADQATALHANREAAAQYARALRVGASLPDHRLADLYERRANACYLSESFRDAIAARQAALAIRRRAADRAPEGDNVRWLSRLLWFDGRRTDADAAARQAVEILESEPPGPELAMAYSNRSQLAMLASDTDGAEQWGNRAMTLARALDQRETFLHARINVATARMQAGIPSGREELERAIADAIDAGSSEHAARAMTNLAWGALTSYDLTVAELAIGRALDYATRHDLDHYRRYLLAQQSLLRLRRGDWDAALTGAETLVRQSTLSPPARIVALTVVGTIRARRGVPDVIDALDDALHLADRTGELQRLVPVCIARAEHAWLNGDRATGAAELARISDAVERTGTPTMKGEVAELQNRLGVFRRAAPAVPEPFALALAGDAGAAAAAWRDLGCPWEEGIAYLPGDETAVRAAHAIFARLGAAPAAAIAIRRLRSLGARRVPRGPYAAARANPAGLTAREIDVLSCLAAGLRNAEIASRLFVSPKTVEHHVSAILAKLNAGSREQAVIAASRLGLHCSPNFEGVTAER